jgi:TPR repeat protein
MDNTDVELYSTARRLLKKGRYSEARAAYQQLAEKGDVNCRVMLGWLTYEGLGGEKDESRALALLHEAAATGSKQGQFYFGRYLLKAHRYAEALEWLNMSAANGYGPALLWLGVVHVRGIGVEPDLSRGTRYLSRSAKAGNILAMRELALLMLRGRLGWLRVPLGVLLLLFSVAIGISTAILREDSDRLIG